MIGLGAFKMPAAWLKGAAPNTESIGANSSDDARMSSGAVLNDDFRRVVKDLELAFAQKNFRINFGKYGYMNALQLDTAAKNGRPGYLALKQYFGWGLAIEVENLTNPKGTLVSPGVLFNSVLGVSSDTAKMLTDRGLVYNEWKDEFGVVKLRFIRPKDIKLGNVDKLTYDGDYVSSGSSSDSSSTGTTGGTSSAAPASSNPASVASTAYFFANEFTQIQTSMESYLLTGDRALANDVALWNSVKKAVNSSLRVCSSDPDGNFLAWYPDYWGKHGVTPHTIISDVELVDLTITQSDSEMVTHVFCPGVNQVGGKLPMGNMFTQGVVSIESNDAAVMSEASVSEEQGYVVSDTVSPILEKLIYIPEGEGWKYTPKEIYRRYGARPAKTQSLPNLSSAKLVEDVGENKTAEDEGEAPEHILPFLYALYEFMWHWARQYQANIDVTFMPEVMPGSRIKVESLDIEFYVESVTHTMSYAGGFTTKLGTICPVGSLVSGMVNPD